jgi:hypothetical protein
VTAGTCGKGGKIEGMKGGEKKKEDEKEGRKEARREGMVHLQTGRVT